eukprot:365083-Chlamydomonas_euryale.AAC.45
MRLRDDELVRVGARRDVVEDDGDDELQHKQRDHDHVGAEEEHSDDRRRAARVDQVVARDLAQQRRAGVEVAPSRHRDVAAARPVGQNVHTRLLRHAVRHDRVPVLAGQHAEERLQRVRKVVKVGVRVDLLAVAHIAEEVHAGDSVDEHQDEHHDADVEERRERPHKREEHEPQAAQPWQQAHDT